MAKNQRHLLFAIIVIVWSSASLPAAADPYPVDIFFGEYVGSTISTGEGGLSERDLSVNIHPAGKGFAIDWITVTRKPGGKFKRKAYSITFMPSRRENIYAAAMKSNMFGGRVPHDPMKGQPYVWARVNGATLSVFALLITDDGGYEMQVYDRTRTEGGDRSEVLAFP